MTLLQVLLAVGVPNFIMKLQIVLQAPEITVWTEEYLHQVNIIIINY